MVLEFFQPEEQMSWEQWAKITGKKEGLWSWTLKGILEMEERGFDVLLIEDFDYTRFAELGTGYLKERFGDEIAKEQDKNSDIPFEMQTAKQLLHIVPPPQIPSLKDLKRLLNEGYLVICNVNSKSLNEEEGYEGHFVTIYDLTPSHVILHDPGPPAYESREVSVPVFMKAWEISSERDRNIMAFKPRAE